VGWTFEQVVPKPSKVVESVQDALNQAQLPFRGVVQSKLEVTRKATGSGKSDRHGAKLAQKAMPTADREPALLLGNAIEQFRKMETMVGRELEGHGDAVEEPAQNVLPGFLIGVTFGELLYRARLVLFRGVIGIERTKHLVHGIEQSAENFETPGWQALNQAKIVVNVNIKFGKAAAGLLEALEERISGCGKRHAGRNVGWQRRNWLESWRRHGHGLQPRWGLGAVFEQGDIGEVRNGFGCGTEPRWGLNPTHWKSQQEGDERLAEAGKIGEDDSQLQDIF
jgi:hypothetical protein